MSDAEPAGATIPGIGYRLPPGERVLWTGAPDAPRLARDAMHVRALAAYFALLLVAPAFGREPGVPAMAAILGAMVWLLPLGVSIVAFAHGLGRLSARTTVYAITDRRVVIKCGIALPTTFNIPLHTIDTAAVRVRRDGSGDVALTLGGDVRIAWLLLWPHVRPWRFSRPDPTLRSLARVGEVGDVLAGAIRAIPALAAAEVTPVRPVAAPALPPRAREARVPVEAGA